MSDEIRPFRIDIPQAQLDDLRRRLRDTRWPEREAVEDWTQGTPLSYVQEVCAYWAEKYDWRATEARRLLKNRRFSVAAVAEMLGYQSEAAFRRFFKRVEGVGPGKVRGRGDEDEGD